MVGTLTFVHLSDIHFRYKRVGSVFDLDSEIQEELLNDLEVLKQRVESIDGILVTGDIAFSGKIEEYDFARKWLSNIAALIQCPPLNVWCIPGNHDVERSQQKRYAQLPAIHSHLQQAGDMLDERLTVLLEDEPNGSAIFQSFTNYNLFAKDYRSITTREDPKWQDDLPLTPNARLKLRGINSALICSERDGSQARNQLIVGTSQALHHRKKNEVRLTMCHHPPSWLADQATFDDHLCAPGKAPIQLFGHEHRFQIDPQEHYLRLYAGAFQPERDASWVPRYNLIQIQIEDTSGHLTVRVMPRTWTANRRFEADTDSCNGQDTLDWHTDLQWGGDSTEQVEVAPTLGAYKEATTMAEVRDVRKLAYAFFNISFTEAIQISSDLELLKEEDKAVDDMERRRRAFDRAEKTNMLKQLWERVRLLDHKLGPDNPF